MFAEAGKECIDFLFHILALPLGSVIRLLTTNCLDGDGMIIMGIMFVFIIPKKAVWYGTIS